jgi:hypothetical protein
MTHEHYILNDEHVPVPVDLMTWATWLGSDASRRIVQQDDVGDYWVSTVFLGLDHNWCEQGPPLLFETIIFARKSADKDDIESMWMERYSTWELALSGHRRACAVGECHEAK